MKRATFLWPIYENRTEMTLISILTVFFQINSFFLQTYYKYMFTVDGLLVYKNGYTKSYI